MGMSLAHGGHLTHGASVLTFRVVSMMRFSTGLMTMVISIMTRLKRLALEHKPKLLMTGFSAYSRVVDWERFREIADKVGAIMVADIAHVAGLVATGEYPSPVQIADVTTSTTHKTLRGPRSGIIMGKANEDFQKKINFMVFPCVPRWSTHAYDRG